jgi:5-oxoprolinase (ATP-hydrolysing) subunit A
MRVDLNADAGESFGAWALGDDAALFSHVTSVNVACGFHAGDPSSIRRTIRLAADAGVRIGAHPGYPDLQGFGRRAMTLTPREVEDLVLYQVAALLGIASAEGVRLAHVKPHGALYNQAARDPVTAAAIARAVASVDPGLVLVGLAGSSLIKAADDAGLSSAAEAFADRAYLADGSLAPRHLAGAVIQDADIVARRALGIVRERRVRSLDAEVDVPVRAETLCLHGDTPGAPALARAVRAALEGAGVRVVALRGAPGVWVPDSTRRD